MRDTIFSKGYAQVLLFVVIFSFVFSGTALAQSRVGITISPPIIEENVVPGSVHNFIVRLKNVGTEEEILYPRLYNVSGISVNGQPTFSKINEAGPHELSAWITFEQEIITIAPGGQATLTFTANVPANASPGAHIGSVAFSRDSVAPTQGSGVGYEVHSIVSLRVAGEVIERTRVKDFFTDQIFFSSVKVKFSTTILNEGNVFARPKGFIDIKNMFGNKVETIPVNDGGSSVFPSSERIYTADWTSDSFQIGKYVAEMTLTVEGEKGFESLLSTVEFWIVPTHIVLPALGGLLVFLMIFWVILRLYVRSQIKRATGGRAAARAREATSLSRLSIIVIGLLISVILGLVILLFLLG